MRRTRKGRTQGAEYNPRVASGFAVSLVLTKAMASMIYDLDTSDPTTLGAVALTLSVTALLACCRPAYRAAALDPLVALRGD